MSLRNSLLIGFKIFYTSQTLSICFLIDFVENMFCYQECKFTK